MQPDTLARTITLIRAHLSGHRSPHSVPAITAESSFERDLRCDAIDIVCIELAAEDEFHVRFPAERMEACETVGDLAELVRVLIKEPVL